jgi:hypothetical protein
VSQRRKVQREYLEAGCQKIGHKKQDVGSWSEYGRHECTWDEDSF